ncbi:helix-turn-helix transcriptional regulator [Saccharibacillus deserti]|uniref:helix-turn-helix transcriptional regulator n=1 Tax=Saccharibacillus deserti TaxID=1634444 RepID=UPI001C631225|nr:LuxR C-terminal-related transcriptional regulator [Saccharibacillus deserti]
MRPPLIETKLFVPRILSGTVDRPHLIGLLEAGSRRKLTVIAAPAGYGKTTLAAQWLAACGLPAAWITLDEGDNDFARFLTYFTAAVDRHSGRRSGEALRLLESPQPPSPETTGTVLIAGLDQSADPCVLVLDDYHTIRAETVHRLISFLLHYLPPHIRLVLLTREEPDLPLARLRIQGEVNDIGTAELRFGPDETFAFLNEAAGISVRREELYALAERTEGWIAGLQFAAASLRDRPLSGQQLQDFGGSRSGLTDYLIEEVLHKQPESVQRFLLRTSFLERLCGSLCDAVLLDASLSGQKMLRLLERAHLFVVPLDDERHWYRYHPLFAEALRRRWRWLTDSVREKDEEAERYARASDWYAGSGLLGESFAYAVGSGRFELAAKLAEGEGMPLHLLGEMRSVLRWLESLPPSMLDERPSLWVLYGSALLLAGRPTEIESKFQAAEALMEEWGSDTRTRNLRGLIAATRAAAVGVAIAGHAGSADRRLEAAEDILQAGEAEDKTSALIERIVGDGGRALRRTEELEAVIRLSQLAIRDLDTRMMPIRMTMYWLIGAASRFLGYNGQAEKAYSAVLNLDRKLGGSLIGAMANTDLGRLYEEEARLHEAEDCYRRALDNLRELPLQAAYEACLGRARIFRKRKEPEKALEYVRKSRELARRSGNPELELEALLLAGRVWLDSGQTEEAEAMASEADKKVHFHRLPDGSAKVARFRTSILEYRSARRIEGFAYPTPEPLTLRETEILRLIADGLSNAEIGARLFLALDTVKGHNRRIFGKLQVQRRTEAIARARKLGLID